jgi:N-acetylglutamate synthase-like GNAT family acetyltransferase
MRIMNADKTFTLRHHLCPGDLGRIVTLHGELYDREYGFGPQFEAYAAETLAEFGKPERTERDRLWVAEIDGRIVGSIGIIGREDNAAQLRCLLIAPEGRGIGLGRRLLEAALAFCRAVGYDSVFLWTVQGLLAAAHLYASAGFVKTHELPPSNWGVPVIEERYELWL